MAKDQGKISLNSTTRVRITIAYIEHLNMLRCLVQFLRSGRSRHVGAFFFSLICGTLLIRNVL